MLSVPASVAAMCLRDKPLPPGTSTEESQARGLKLSMTDQRTRGYFEPMASLAALSACNRHWRFTLDLHEVWLASMGLKVHNVLPPCFSRMRLARHIHAARKHPHLTRRILCGLNSQKQPEIVIANVPPKKMSTIIVQLAPHEEASYWLERFLSLMKTSAVPTLAQCGDVASAFAFMRESNGVALSPKSIVLTADIRPGLSPHPICMS